MSLPSGGSTAPAITEPLLAWPARPVARLPLSPSSSRSHSDDAFGSVPLSASTSYSRPDDNCSSKSNSGIRRQPSLKGKERAAAPEVRVESTGDYSHLDQEGDGDGDHVQSQRHVYAPPKSPLPPHQLGRIAQSFGIVIPTLPQHPTLTTPSPNPTFQRPLSPGTIPIGSASSRGRLSPLLGASSPTRPSPYLLSVIPPLILLTPSSLDPESTVRRAKKWRRGKLVPLQPTLRSMLVSIAREYGLPSTIGIGVYLVLPNPSSSSSKGDDLSSAGSSWSLSDDEEPSGPQISPSTWNTFFAAYLTSMGGTSTRSSTPSTTPVKGVGSLGRDIAYPPSPLSMAGINSSLSGRKPKVRSLSSGPTPTKPLLSHSSNNSTSTSSSTLPPTPASISALPFPALSPNPIVGTIEFDIDLDEATWFEDWRRSGGASRHKRSLTGEGGMKELSLVRKVQDERPRFLKELDVNQLSVERKRTSVHGTGIVSNSASFHGFDMESDSGNITVASEPVLLSAKETDDLLASPVDLNKLHADSAMSEHVALKQIQSALDKRGSNYVMSDQLDDLEKIMRQLSPREIRLTSPRILTPRMAAKVANTPLELPAVPRSNIVTVKQSSSPLAETFTSPDLSGQIDFSSPVRENFAPPRPAWPAVPHGSPGSPSAAQDYFARQDRMPTQIHRNVSSPAVLSAETQKRMQEAITADADAIGKASVAGGEWVPRRPARPPSPKLPHQRTLSHTLSPDLVDYLHRSPPPSGFDPISPPGIPAGTGTEEKKHKSRQGSISLKGLRHQMSGKNLGGMWRGGEKEKEKEPIGLFKGAVEIEKSSFPGLRETHGNGHGQRSVSSPITTEFGKLPTSVPAEVAMESVPSKSSGSRFASRIFGFRDSVRSVSSGSTSSSKRHPHPSADKISAPIISSFKHENGSPVVGVPESATLPPNPTSPTLPSSPRSVRRKPVPTPVGMGVGVRIESDGGEAMVPSESLASMASFVLEDPPRGKRSISAYANGSTGMAV